MSNITVLGTGAMGSRMAKVLLDAGHKITVWNRNHKRTAALVHAGARSATSPRAAVESADFAISMVRDNEASRDVWLDAEAGALAGLPESAIAIESSTLTPEWICRLNEHFLQKNASFLDAPVVGTRPQAEAAQLIYVVGGNEDTFARAEPILMAMGNIVHHVGPAGSGAAVKLMINALFGIQVAAMAELIALIENYGFDKDNAIGAISSTPVCSPAAKVAAGAMAARKFAPLFPIELVEKDFNYALQMATSSSSHVPVIEAVQAIFEKAGVQGYGDDNITGVVQSYL